MEIRELICIGCPIGCNLKVELQGKEVIKVSGNSCKIGLEYGKNECTNPQRMVTSTAIVIGGEERVVSVKTKGDIPKGKIFEIIGELKKIELKAPVYIGDIVIRNVAGTGIDIVATKNNKRI